MIHFGKDQLCSQFETILCICHVQYLNAILKFHNFATIILLLVVFSDMLYRSLVYFSKFPLVDSTQNINFLSFIHLQYLNLQEKLTQKYVTYTTEYIYRRQCSYNLYVLCENLMFQTSTEPHTVTNYVHFRWDFCCCDRKFHLTLHT